MQSEELRCLQGGCARPFFGGNELNLLVRWCGHDGSTAWRQTLFAGSQSLLPNLQHPCWCQTPPQCSAALPERAPAPEPPRDAQQEQVGWGRGLGSGSAPSPVATQTSLLLLTEPVSKACPASKEVSVEDKSSSSNYGTESFI